MLLQLIFISKQAWVFNHQYVYEVYFVISQGLSLNKTELEFI